MQYNYWSKHLVIRDSSNKQDRSNKQTSSRKQTISTESTIIIEKDIDPDIFVYRYEKCKFVKPILSFQAKHIFTGKSKICQMTEFSEANDSSDFDGNTILLKCQDNECVFFSGCEIIKFITEDKIIDYISLMGNIMCPSTIAIGEKNTYFISHHDKFFENDKIDEGTLLNKTNEYLDPFLYHLGKCDVGSFKTLERSQIHSFYLDCEEDGENGADLLVEDLIETNYYNGNNEVVKLFNQKYVICYGRDSVYDFRQCGHQCICERWYQNKGDIDSSKCVFVEHNFTCTFIHI